MSLQTKPVTDNNAARANGAVINGAVAARRKRTSSLMQVAAALPSVESSLEDFISRANSAPDTGGWGISPDAGKISEEQLAVQVAAIEAQAEERRKQDATRWKAAEAQLRTEAEQRENTLKKQLDALQGKLAAAEARAAVAMDSDAGGAAAAAMAELQSKLAKSEERAKSAEASAKASQAKISELAAAAATAAPQPVAAAVPPASGGDQALRAAVAAAEEKAKIADARATKALAAARAASAGLTVSHDDIEKIANGLTPVALEAAPPKKTPILGIVGAFAGGLGAMFVATKLMSKDAPATQPAVAPAPAQVQTAPQAPAPQPTAVQPAVAQPAVAQPAVAQPAVVPAEPTPAPTPANVAGDSNKPTVTPINDTDSAEPSLTPLVDETEPKAATAPVRAAPTRPKKPAAPAVKKAPTADPFADSPKAPAKAPAAPKTAKPKIVDPF